MINIKIKSHEPLCREYILEKVRSLVKKVYWGSLTSIVCDHGCQDSVAVDSDLLVSHGCQKNLGLLSSRPSLYTRKSKTIKWGVCKENGRKEDDGCRSFFCPLYRAIDNCCKDYPHRDHLEVVISDRRID